MSTKNLTDQFAPNPQGLDFNGVRPQPGSVVTYPTRRGSGMWLSQGTVKQNLGEQLQVEVTTDTDGKRIVYVPTKRCVVLPAPNAINALRVIRETGDKVRLAINAGVTPTYADRINFNEALREVEKAVA